ncbi:ATP-binding protein [uncultured Dubosiella sp.]|uniref:ATP-binding protein n=1 Tax=uncultured Dubosiella sp. TaxID=1937011 RepID=UPI002638F2DF|nr:DUF87 domain-containing protein [uncultured Dubosiella sp.]
MEDIDVGYIIEVNGIKIIGKMYENSNDLTFFYKGVIYQSPSVGQFIGIRRGQYILIGRIEREFLFDTYHDENTLEYGKNRIERRIEISLLGFIENEEFKVGIIAYPMIYNQVILLSEKQIQQIITKQFIENQDMSILIGKTVRENIDVRLNTSNIFNTHIGIFGNTGSGKSNTLAKIYSEVFDKEEFGEFDLSNSKFMFLDFNGEYIEKNVLSSKKKVINLSTRESKNSDKLKISKKTFWDIEVLSIILSATEKTQKPFLKNAIRRTLNPDNQEITRETIIERIGTAFYLTFKMNNTKETNNFLHRIYDELDFNTNAKERIPYYRAFWHSTQNTYYLSNNDYFTSKSDVKIRNDRDTLQSILDRNLPEDISITKKMKIALYVQMVVGLAYGSVNFEHINPLLERLNSKSSIIDRLFEITDKPYDENVIVVSMKNCNTEAKKMVSLLIAKNTYSNHRSCRLLNDKETTFHLIIDEAHNILSEQSNREEKTWKDYRLEVFEEIIKEGRKFGYYVTLASQRPADISQTLVSQLHNYFLHRLVSEQDVQMINNTINTLDKVSKSQLPLLAPGQCIITGTSFSMPLVVQINKLSRDKSPNSESADLKILWHREIE